jgi:hypothetical protein
VILIGLTKLALTRAQTNETSTPKAPSAFVMPARHRTMLASGVISIPATYITSQCFQISNDMRSAIVTGRFQASGGAQNDIQVVLATEDNFTNWRNRNGGVLLYDSGRTTVGKVYISLPDEGRYCLGFVNGFSLFSAKSVSADGLGEGVAAGA